MADFSKMNEQHRNKALQRYYHYANINELEVAFQKQRENFIRLGYRLPYFRPKEGLIEVDYSIQYDERGASVEYREDERDRERKERERQNTAYLRATYIKDLKATYSSELAFMCLAEFWSDSDEAYRWRALDYHVDFFLAFLGELRDFERMTCSLGLVPVAMLGLPLQTTQSYEEAFSTTNRHQTTQG